MHRAKRWIGLLLWLAVASAGPAAATVIVQDTDISGGEYLFEMNYANIGSQYSAALLSSTNFPGPVALTHLHNAIDLPVNRDFKTIHLDQQHSAGVQRKPKVIRFI